MLAARETHFIARQRACGYCLAIGRVERRSASRLSQLGYCYECYLMRTANSGLIPSPPCPLPPSSFLALQALIMCYPHTDDKNFDAPEYTVLAEGR